MINLSEIKEGNSYKLFVHYKPLANEALARVEIFDAKVTHVEKKEDYLYVGYTPFDDKFGKFGYIRVYEKPKEWGLYNIWLIESAV